MKISLLALTSLHHSAFRGWSESVDQELVGQSSQLRGVAR